MESTKSATSTRPSIATRPTAASAAKKADPTRATTEAEKAKPRSPTRPVKLPSHLTAPTASSAAKRGEAPSTNSSTARKPAPRPNTGATKLAPTRRDGPRQSLPATSTTKRPESRASARTPDDGFLARMMRPTASSASKSAEKTGEKPELKSLPKRANSVRSKPSVSSLIGKTKRVAPTARKSKELVRNGNVGQDETLHEGESSILAQDATATEIAHGDSIDALEASELSQAEREAEPVTAAEQAAPQEPVSEVVNDSGPEAVKDPAPKGEKDLAPKGVKDPAPEAVRDPAPEGTTVPVPEPAKELEAVAAEEPISKPTSELPQTPTKKDILEEPALAATPKPINASTPDTAAEPSTGVAHEGSHDVAIGSGKAAEKTPEASEGDGELFVESTPEQARTADAALEQTPSFGRAAIR